MSASGGLVIEASKEYDRGNEQEFREDVRRKLGKGYKKDGNVIIPFGYELGFTAPNGNEYRFSVDGSNNLTFGIETETPVSLASVELVASVSADVASLSSEIVAARGGQATLLARITQVDTARVDGDAAIASSVTTLSATVATNTANITTNATAIATVDGKLSASYGIAVDVNGRIASLKLLSNGTTSSIEFTATTFKVYNGTTTDTPFEISGGVVKIKTANVGVLTAANISVTTLSALSADLGTITAGQLNLTSGSYVVRHGAGFGASSDLVMWYGASATAIGSATKTNGVFALATDGKVYLGALSVNAPITMTFSPTSVSYSAAGSGGNSDAITVTASGGTGSYTYQWFVSIQAMTGTSTLLISSGATSATCTVAGTFSSGGDISGRAYCVVTDSNGYQATGSLPVSYSSTS